MNFLFLVWKTKVHEAKERRRSVMGFASDDGSVRAENKNHSQRWGGEKVFQVDIEETYYARVCGFFGLGKHLVFVFF